jgi:MFS family permease
MKNVYLFAVFNALSFQMVLSSPMVLYAKSLGASATVLGIIASMMPLLVIFQIPAAQYVDRVGYKKFVFSGWSLRVAFIFGMAMVPLSGLFLNLTTQLALLLALLFGFNLSRGISTCAWLPWLTALVPESLRGRYLAREAACVNLASFGAFLLAAVCLAGNPRPWQFTILFAFSGLMGAASLLFLKKIPDVEPPAPVRRSGNPVPWLEIARFDPFRRLLETVVLWCLAAGGIGAFTVMYLKTEGNLGDGTILAVSSVAFLGGLSSLWLLGSRLDHLGSKPVLRFAFGMWLVVVGVWALLAGQVVPVRLGVILALQFFMGLFSSLINMATTRLAMAIVPKMGRSHFFALYSVVANIAVGISPVLWGLCIDAVGAREGMFLGIEWNRYTVFFAGVFVSLGATLVLARRLHEPAAASMEALLREILIHSPQRMWLRLWPR